MHHCSLCLRSRDGVERQVWAQFTYAPVISEGHRVFEVYVASLRDQDGAEVEIPDHQRAQFAAYLMQVYRDGPGELPPASGGLLASEALAADDTGRANFGGPAARKADADEAGA